MHVRSRLILSLCALAAAAAFACGPSPGTSGAGRQDAGPDGGGADAGQPDAGWDAGPQPDAGPITGTVGSSGGTVSRLYFAVVGDTRPANLNDTANYPTGIIDQIYQRIEALSPRPQFVVATGDYMYASISGSNAQNQIDLYKQATAAFTGGPVFPAMGNHECDGYTATNCSSSTTYANYTAYSSTMLSPIGQSKPYYSIDFQTDFGTAKLVTVACNMWSSTQKSWLQGQLSAGATFTIVADHEPDYTTNAPCNGDLVAVMSSHPYNLWLAGHSHKFDRAGGGKEIIVGTGGAPLSSTSDTYGFATVEQLLPSQGFKITEWSASTGLPIYSFLVP